MEAAEERRAAAGDAAAAVVSASGGGRGPSLTGQSYWLDVWLMLLIDLVLFVFVYLLP